MFYFVIGILAIALIYAHYSVPKKISNLKKLKKDGTRAEADVVSASVTKRSGSTPMVSLRYKFKDYLGKEHQYTEQNLAPKYVKSLSEGDKIQIKYLSNKPNVSAVAGKEDSGIKKMRFGLLVMLILDAAIAFGVYSEYYAAS